MASSFANDICVNDLTKRGNKTKINTLCVADWHLTADQLTASFVVLGGLLVFSSVWVAVSRMQKNKLSKDEIGFSRVLKIWANSSRKAAIMNRMVQFVVSIAITITFAFRCGSYTVTGSGYHTLTMLYLISFFDLVVRFLKANHKISWVFSPYTMLEVICITSHFMLGYAPDKLINGISSRTWLDFSVMRPIFIYRSFVEMERNFPRASKGWMLFRLWVKSLLLIFFAAGVMFFLETLGEIPAFESSGFAHLYQCGDKIVRNVNECTDPSDASETWSIFFAFYFTVVTLTTVGYGDNSPQTVATRLLIIVFIVAGIILFSMEIENWISVFNLKRTGNPPYKRQRRTFHVVIMGNPGYNQLLATLREFFHEDHTLEIQPDCSLHAVVLGERSSSYSKQLVKKLETDVEFAISVTYVAGSPTNTEDLDRAGVVDALAVLVFPNKLATDAYEEDSKNILRVLSTKRHVGPHLRCLVMLLRAENMRHLLAAGIHRDDIICEDTIKMGVLAQSCRCPGYSTIIANFSASLTIEKGIRDTEENVVKQASKQITYIKGGLREKAKKGTVRLSNLSNTTPGSCDGSKSKTSCKANWKKEYFEGASHEIYLVELTKTYSNLTFAEASLKAFKESEGQVVLIAVEVYLNNIVGGLEDEENRVLLSPGHGIRITHGVSVYAIAEDIQSMINMGICIPPMGADDRLLMDATPNQQEEDNETAILASKTQRFLSKDDFDDKTAMLVSTPDDRDNKLDSDYASVKTPISHLAPTEFDPIRRSLEPIKLEDSLARVALQYRLQHSYARISSHDQFVSVELSDQFNTSRSPIPGDISSLRPLTPPPLEVLQNPNHIVICSYLGSSSLPSLQWFLSPLRGVNATKEFPITILDEANPSHEWARVLSRFENVYHVRGSPLVYRELQRAGAKAARAVVILAKSASSNNSTSSSMTNSRSTSSAEQADADNEEYSEEQDGFGGAGAGTSRDNESIVDAEAIFTTMLVELKLDISKIFTITELVDEMNSKFLGGNGSGNSELEDEKNQSMIANLKAEQSFINIALRTKKQGIFDNSIFGLPMYMSGGLYHPQLCENLLVQSFFNHNMHRIFRQLVGGARSTGCVYSFRIPKIMRQDTKEQSASKHYMERDSFSDTEEYNADGLKKLPKPAYTYGEVFEYFTSSKLSGIPIGLYRQVGKKLPVVLATPHTDMEVLDSDLVYVLIGWHTMDRAVERIQAMFRTARLRNLGKKKD